MNKRRVHAGEIINLALLGGQGTRLHELTRYKDIHFRAKPAVPIFGKYRIVDLLLSNLYNSGCTGVTTLLQYGAQPLSNYLSHAWGREMRLDFAFAEKADLTNIFRGTADAVRQCSVSLSRKNGQIVAIWSGDHITKFDVRPFLQWHQEVGAQFSIAAMPVPLEQASQFGILEVDEEGCIISFVEKPGSKDNPDVVAPQIPGRPGYVLASLGNYMVNKKYLLDVLHQQPDKHDFGKDIIPEIITSGDVYAYDMSQVILPGDEAFFWADVGTLEEYFDMHMRMLKPIPPVNLYNDQWPIRFLPDVLSPARYIGENNVFDSVSVSGGCQCEGLKGHFVFLGRSCDVRNSELDQVLLLGYNRVGHRSKLRRTIVDHEVCIPPGTHIGFDHDEDEARGFKVYRDSDITIVPRYYEFL